jgi:hypothetical protein
VFITAFVIGSLVAALLVDPISQDLAYHNFADGRRFLGIPNALNVASNFFFLVVGLLGLRTLRHSEKQPSYAAWVVFFSGVLFVSFGSGYYHISPNNSSLVWDRLPMTVGFMGLFVALVTDFGESKLGAVPLVLFALIGVGSVAYWSYTDDLRIYAWVQFMPLGVILLLLCFGKSRYTHSALLALSLACYMTAKLVEYLDVTIFQLTGSIVGGHTLKHLAASIGCYILVVFLQKRQVQIEFKSV